MDTAIINIHSAEYLPRDEWLCITLIGGKSWWGDSKVSRVACFGMDSEAMIEKSTSHSALWNQNSSTCYLLSSSFLSFRLHRMSKRIFTFWVKLEFSQFNPILSIYWRIEELRRIERRSSKERTRLRNQVSIRGVYLRSLESSVLNMYVSRSF